MRFKTEGVIILKVMQKATLRPNQVNPREFKQFEIANRYLVVLTIWLNGICAIRINIALTACASCPHTDVCSSGFSRGIPCERRTG